MSTAARAWVSVLTLCLVAALLGPPGAAAIDGGQIVQRLSQQREANGIPGGLVERTDWSEACAKHNSYEAKTGEFGHSEDSSSPYYSAEGDWAAQNSALAWGGLTWAVGNPWEEAPIHLIQLLAPRLSEMGAAENDGFNCATTWVGNKRPEPDELTAYSYPGDGVSGVVPTERAAESPFVPGDFVGLPEGTATGRYLLAFLSGVDPVDASDVTATATLSSSDGPTELRVIDSTSPDIGGYMPQPSAFLIPAQPLKPLTRYQAEVAWAMEGAELFRQRFSFTTGTDPGQAPTAVKKKRSSCNRYARAARLLRRRAARLQTRGAVLHGKGSSQSQRRRAQRLLSRSHRLKRQARHRSRRAKRCRANLRSG